MVNREKSPLAFDTGWQYDPAPESTDHVSIDERYGLFIDGELKLQLVDRISSLGDKEVVLHQPDIGRSLPT